MHITSPAITSRLAKEMGASLRPWTQLDALHFIVADETNSREFVNIEEGKLEYEYTSEALAKLVPELSDHLLNKVNWRNYWRTCIERS